MKTKSGTVISRHQDESEFRHLPVVDLLVDTKTELLALALRSGLKVFTAFEVVTVPAQLAAVMV